MLYKKIKADIDNMLNLAQLQAGTKPQHLDIGKSLFLLLAKYHKDILAHNETVLSFTWQLLKQKELAADIFHQVFAGFIHEIKTQKSALCSSTEIDLYEKSLACEQSTVCEGTIHVESGLLPLTPPKLQLPDEFSPWDSLAASLSEHLRHGSAKAAIEALPLLDATTLEDDDLARASVVLSAFAHAYNFSERGKPIESIPSTVLTPWTIVNKRLGRGEPPYRSGHDHFNYNWRLKDTSSPITTKNLSPLFPYFTDENEDSVTVATVVGIMHLFSPAFMEMAKAQTAVLLKNDQLLESSLAKLITIMRTIVPELEHQSPASFSPGAMDPVVWGKTMGTITRASHNKELDGSGVDTPLFYFFDAFINRVSFETPAGKQMVQREALLPENNRELLKVMRADSSVMKYIVSGSNVRLKQLYTTLVNLYAGERGYLDLHRLKAVGAIKLMVQGGRPNSTTNRDAQVSERVHETVEADKVTAMINGVLQSAITERLTDQTLGQFHHVTPQNIRRDANYCLVSIPLAVDFKLGDKACILAENTLQEIEYFCTWFSLSLEDEVELNSTLQEFFKINFGRAVLKMRLRDLCQFADLNISKFELSALRPMNPRYFSYAGNDEHGHASFLIDISQVGTEPKAWKVTSKLLAGQSISAKHIPCYDYRYSPEDEVFALTCGTGLGPFLAMLNEDSTAESRKTLIIIVKDFEHSVFKEQLLAAVRAKRLNLYVASSEASSKYLFTQYSPEVPNGQVLTESASRLNIQQCIQVSGLHAHMMQALTQGTGYFYCCGNASIAETMQTLMTRLCLQTKINIELLIAQKHLVIEMFSRQESLQHPRLAVIAPHEVMMHNKVREEGSDCHVIISGKVFDLSTYVGKHPGGVKILGTNAGLDASADFSLIHARSPMIWGALQPMMIGVVASESQIASSPDWASLIKYITQSQNLIFINFNYQKAVSFHLIQAKIQKFFVDTIAIVQELLNQQKIEESPQTVFYVSPQLIQLATHELTEKTALMAKHIESHPKEPADYLVENGFVRKIATLCDDALEKVKTLLCHHLTHHQEQLDSKKLAYMIKLILNDYLLQVIRTIRTNHFDEDYTAAQKTLGPLFQALQESAPKIKAGHVQMDSHQVAYMNSSRPTQYAS